MSLTPAQSRDPLQSEDGVRDYYDHNTNLFLKLGANRMTRAIHQPLFLNGDESLYEALHTQHRLILEVILSDKTNPVNQVLDLGCGVGSALQFLAPLLPKSQFTGITLSPKQAAKGQSWLMSQRISNAHIIVGSFQALPDSVSNTDLAYAIESFIHATDAELFFTEVSKNLPVGGKLIIFDDVLATKADREAQHVEAFISGWKANSLHTPDEITHLGLGAGLRLKEERDLTGYQRLWRLRDKWISIIQPILNLLPISHEYRQFLRGGNARQHLYRADNLKYVMLVFEKQAHP